MAKIASLHCAAGHIMRWRASLKAYRHVRSTLECQLPPDPTMTTWE